MKMEKRKISILIVGEPNSGKSRVLKLIKDFLNKEEFNVKFDGGIDFKDEADFDTHHETVLKSGISPISERTEISISEKSVNRSLI
jgi:ABC-type polysaccharide/polyol phosphate transport system ATPase subunit